MKMRKRVLICLLILSVLGSIIILSKAIDLNPHQPDYTIGNPAVSSSGGIYFCENFGEFGYLYRLNDAGIVLRILKSTSVKCEHIVSVYAMDEAVYALWYSLDPAEDQIVIQYRIAKYDPELNLIGCTDKFILKDEADARHVSADGENLYVTAVNSQAGSVDIFAMAEEDTILTTKDAFDMEAERGKKKLPDSAPLAFSRTSPESAFFVDAQYKDGTVYVLTDVSEPQAPFVPDSRVANAMKQLRFNFWQKLLFYQDYLIVWVSGLLIWCFVLILAYMMLIDKNRMAYIFVTTEASYLFILIVFLLILRWQYLTDRKTEYLEYAEMSLSGELDSLGNLDQFAFDDDYYYSTDYGDLKNEFARFGALGENERVFLDLFLLDLEDGKILASYSGYNRQYASYVYSGKMISLRESLAGTEHWATEPINSGIIQMNAVGVRAHTTKKPIALVGICYNGLFVVTFLASYRMLIPIILGLFVIGSLVISLIMYLQSLDLRQFVNAIENVALGRTRLRVPEYPAKDVRAMWASLSELAKKMDETNHEKYRIFEAYYRFAPKNIETIMDKDSIFDVKNGDMVMKEGSLLMFSIEDQESEEKRIKSLVNIVAYMAEYTDNKDGILVSYDGSLTELEYLFLDEKTTIIDKTNRFLHRNAFDVDSVFVSAFLHHDPFTYGVVGVGAQSLSFLTTQYNKEMKDCAFWFETLKVPLVITERILYREDPGEIRYIGFAVIAGIKVELFEVLDACSARDRQNKIVQRDKFEKSISAFHKGDYYKARNQFSELYKEFPEDLLVKWYLFESERYLNGETDSIATGRLRMEMKYS